MKTKLFLALSCLLLLAETGQAQRFSPSFYIAPPGEGEDFVQKNSYPGIQQLAESNLKIAVRSLWEGGTVRMVDELLDDPDIRKAWGVSPNQYLQFTHGAWGKAGDAIKNDPEMQRLQVLMDDVDVEGGKIRGFDEETLAISYAQGKRSDDLMTLRLSHSFGNTFTPEQRQTMNEAFLASMSELPMILPDMFEALDLTDAQRQQMDDIKKGLESEFEKTLDDFVAYQMVLRNMLIYELGKQGVETVKFSDDPRERAIAFSAFSNKTEAAMKKLSEHPEYKKIQDALQSKTKAFSTRFKTKMFDVLTDEQWVRLQKLVDNPPKHAQALLKKLKTQRDEAEKTGVWTPGPNSWQPGDPIPGGYREERNKQGNFPRPAASTPKEGE